MTTAEVRRIAEPLLKSLLDGSLEEVAVREDEDWSGTPSIYIDVFLAPRRGRPTTLAVAG